MKVNKSNTNKEVIRKPTKKIDGRSATRTGRIVQFATSVTVDFDNTIRQLARDDEEISSFAQADQITQSELLTKGLELCQKDRAKKKSLISQIQQNLLLQIGAQPPKSTTIWLTPPNKSFSNVRLICIVIRILLYLTKSKKNMINIHNKYSPDWEKEIKRLSLILKDDKSKKLETLLTEHTELEKDYQTKTQAIRKSSNERKKLLNIASYTREIEKEETRLNTNSTTHNPRMKNFLGTGTEIETTEEQILNTIAYLVQALKKIDKDDFTAKYNAKQSDTAKQAKVATYLTNIQQQEIIVGSNTYDFASTYQKFDKSEAYSTEQLKDYGINIDPTKTTLYKTGSEKQTLAVGSVTDGTNYTLPESLTSIQEIKDQLEMEKLGAAVKLVELKKTIDEKR
ncbi:14697_t:CDS:2, partial [Cetraspora pellucida]